MKAVITITDELVELGTAVATESGLLLREGTQMWAFSERELAAAFTEWDRRFREDPDRFRSEAARLLKGTPETYGDACAPYLLAILEEQRS
jgi:hypothetical protein